MPVRRGGPQVLTKKVSPSSDGQDRCLSDAGKFCFPKGDDLPTSDCGFAMGSHTLLLYCSTLPHRFPPTSVLDVGRVTTPSLFPRESIDQKLRGRFGSLLIEQVYVVVTSCHEMNGRGILQQLKRYGRKERKKGRKERKGHGKVAIYIGRK